jgi:hypothetical protein
LTLEIEDSLKLGVMMMDINAPDPLDALIAAPDHHRLLMENERVRVLETLIPAGDRTPIHTHCWASVLHIISWSPFIRYDDKGEIILETQKVEALRNPPSILWGAALPPHSLENIGDTELRIVAVELKDTE